MSPTIPRGKLMKKFAALFTAIALVIAALMLSTPAGASGNGTSKITFCHATGSDSNPYVLITTSVAAFYNAGHLDHQNDEDIFPAGSFKNQSWEAQGDQSLIATGCDSTPEEPEEPLVVTPLVPTFTDLCGPDNEALVTPVQDGVVFDVTEEPVGTFTVVAYPADDTYVIAEGAVSTWTFVANDAACPTETPTTPVVTPEVPTPTISTETPTETPVAVPQPEDETPEPEKDEPVKNVPKDVQVIACVNGVWTITVNGEVISESGTCGETPENSVPQTFSETGL
jgi:hypothetical protein